MAYYPRSSAHPPPGPPLLAQSDLDLVSSLSSPSSQPALKANAAIQAVEPLSRILLDPTASSDSAATKLALAGLASAYPFLFRYATQSSDQMWWSRVVKLKTAVLQLWRTGNLGAKVGAVKVLQRVIQTQSASGTADPRLRAANSSGEPNLSLCRPNHPFLKIAGLEEESNKLLEESITALFTSPSADLVSTLVTSLASLVKTRPQFVKLVLTALTNWSPAALVKQSVTQVRSVEKVLRLTLQHLLKNSHATSFQAQITSFLTIQSQRMELAAAQARQQRDEEASKKRALLTSQIDQQAKRRRLNPSSSSDTVRAFSAANPAPDMQAPSIADLPLQAVIEGVVAVLESVSPASFGAAVEAVRRQLPSDEMPPSQFDTSPFSASSIDHPVVPVPSVASTPVAPTIIDPLQLDLGDDVLSIKAEVPPEPVRDATEAEEEPVNLSVAFEPVNAQVGDGPLSAPLELSATAKEAMLLSTVRRVCTAGMEGARNEVWVPIISRLITRGLDRRGQAEGAANIADQVERLREVVWKFVVEDLQGRTELARLWLNEEWYASHRMGETENRPYDRWLRRFLEHVSAASRNQDKELLQFMMDLPELPPAEIRRLEEMCLNADQMQLGFSTLRELTILRPSVRPAALDVLLGLTTHADKRVRNAAIMTVKKWVPDVKELSELIVRFAVDLLERLKVAPSEKQAEAAVGGDDVDGEAEMTMGETPPPEEPKPPFALVRDGVVIDRLTPPTSVPEVVQHVELLLALCVKDASLLRHLFEHYSELQPIVRASLDDLIEPLIRALGIKHEGILDLLSTFPSGSDALVLRVLDILVGKTKPPASITAAIKQVAAERDIDSRFYALIMSECNKVEILRYLPRVVSLLNGSPQQKAATRSIFLSIIAPPAHFSSINSLRTRSDSLTPVELMVFLHKHDTEMGVKKTIEAISICFSMADGFRPEILAAFMQQVVDEPNMPNLFLRTVIQAVTTYKSLQPFVSTTLLSRLIAKKVWTVGPLWEGFIRLAKAIAPNSFAALLQLPKEQISELVAKQPSMRQPLREYVLKKGGANNARTAAVLEAIGEGDMDSAAGDPGILP
ncbi:hypothetical protein JCM11641_002820 [Rhodosporidiobolus odoratus]